MKYAAAFGVVVLALSQMGGCVSGTINNNDVTLAVTSRVSLTSTQGESNGNSGLASVSSDGRRIAFVSQAKNLHPDDPDGLKDIFVRDMETHTLLLVSRASGEAGVKGNADSDNPMISADGNCVALQSLASTLDPANDASSDSDVYLRNLTTNQTILISRATGLSGAKGFRTAGGYLS